MLPLALKTIVDEIGQRIQHSDPFTWVLDQPTDDDIDHILQQGEPSEFDTLGLRPKVIADFRAGTATLVCKSGPYAKFLAIVYADTVIPWNTLSSIFKAFGPSRKQTPWRIVWLAHPSPRRVPQGEEPRAEHVNGGYTYPCNARTIVVYRKEEMCRVLIHELLHAACTDDMERSEEEREVYTEMWAELFLIGVQSRGSVKKAAALWRIQSQWVADQEATLQHTVRGPANYAWRYTVGRRGAFASLGISLPSSSGIPIQSMRFTAPALCD